MKRAALATLPLLLLTACGWHGTGTVTSKDWSQGFTYTTVVCTGKPPTCIPISNWQPADYRLRVEDSSGNSHDVHVPEGIWDSTRTGDTYTTPQAH